MFENASRTEISSLGEFKLIEHLTAPFSKIQSSTVKGVGDDAAVIEIPGDEYLLVSTDLLVEGVHFDLTFCPLKHVGYKAVTVNLSDIYAMNGQPKQVTVSISFSSKFSLEAIEELYAGIQIACERYGVDLVGGDTTAADKGLTISVTAIGVVNKNRLVYRKGAAAGDLVCVTGDLGAAFTGLQYLLREKKVFLERPAAQPDLEGKDYILERQLKPEARKDIIDFFEKSGIKPTAMIDISDGLSGELHHISKHSKCGVVIYEDKLPMDPTAYQAAIDIGLEATMCITNGGEDYELLFTLHQDDYEKVKHSPDITVIGYCTAEAGSVKMISRQHNEYPLPAMGWEAI